MLVLVMVFAMSPSVYAQELPEVYYEVTEQTVHSGDSFTLEVTLSKPAESDMVVEVTDGRQEYEIPVPAGSSKGSLQLTAGVYTEGERRISYKINRKKEYKRVKPYTQTVTVLAQPCFSFDKSMYTVKVGEVLSLEISCTNNENLREDVSASLCLPDGTELTSLSFSKETGWKMFEYTIPEDWEYPLILTLKDKAGVLAPAQAKIAVIDESRPGIRRVDTTGAIALSFDCGFENEYTQYILDTLDEYNAKATFFVTAMFVRQYPEMLKEIYLRGHEIGNHTVNHYKLNELTPKEIYAEIETVNREVEQVLGIRPTLMRPPYGAGGKTVAAVSRLAGCEVMFWTVDSNDWNTEYTPQMIIERSTEGVGEGYIMLFHNSAPHTQDTLRTILDDYVSKGLQLVSVSELMYNENYIVNENGLQTVNPDYIYISGSEYFGLSTASVDVIGCAEDPQQPTVLSVSPVFGDERALVAKSDAAAVKANSSAVTVTVNCVQPLSAPVRAGEIVGTMTFSYNGQEWFTVDAQASADVLLYVPGSEPVAVPEETGSNAIVYIVDVIAIAAILISLYILFIKKSEKGENA